MKVYTVLTSRDPEALAQFAVQAKQAGATGVTIFTRPDLVAYTPPPGTPTPESFQQQADAAAQRKEYRLAAELQTKADNAAQDLKDMAQQGAAWVRDAVLPIKDITQLVVLGNLHWPANAPFTVTNFLAKIEQVNAPLISTGIGGIVQKTPLTQRAFLPLPTVEAAPVAGGAVTAAGAGPAAAQETPARHPGFPNGLTEKQREYASHRLGLDRDGARRSKQEAGNLMGWSPTIAGKIEAQIVAAWPEFEGLVNGNEPATATTKA